MSVQCSSLLFENRSIKATNNNSNQKCSRIAFSFDHHAMPQKQTKMDFLMSKFRLILLFKSRAWYYQLGRVKKKEDQIKINKKKLRK